MSLQERVLGYAMLHDDARAPVDYKLNNRGQKIHYKCLDTSQLQEIVKKFG